MVLLFSLKHAVFFFNLLSHLEKFENLEKLYKELCKFVKFSYLHF